MSKSILVTGANGFLGSEIVRQALKIGWRVYATDRFPKPAVSGTKYFYSDLSVPGDIVERIRGVDVVIHAAGLAHVFKNKLNKKTNFQKVNVTGTKNIARIAALAGVDHFILVSSVSIYGGSRTGGSEESKSIPVGPYAESKYHGELRSIEIAQDTGMPLTILRLATLYGEGDPGNVFRLIRRIDRGGFIWIGKGLNRKSLMHRDDAARACLLAANMTSDRVAVYNIASQSYTMKEIVSGICTYLRKPETFFSIPTPLARAVSKILIKMPIIRLKQLSETIDKWILDDIYDGRKFSRALGFQASISLEEGLRREVAWYLCQTRTSLK